ncbi:flavodoxin-dependent (E)-4-hydroxy-3-methylbut-2-enyl-diphosphate synthase [Euzebya tangerina]|uniref:flavodoxin-dependent (E)-4-hydroxy-3-methylbut-2-enyl-diphosphate synthase n=1 Tax=Euzebya tangerina TaxID=591198 RepID=UPI000E313F67|nr:flavodoxin-dependent (E)-4-hydroxy-3-methylbut-2-enyl-diphosphate synthase [Euzebya tangerina]
MSQTPTKSGKKSLPILPTTPETAPHQEPPVRRETRQIDVGGVKVGGGAPISVQTMTTTPTHDVNATLQQIAAMNAAGVDIVRVAVPRQEDADALSTIAKQSTVPVVSDIHFQWKYAMQAIEAGVAKVRINPGNIHKAGDTSKVKVIGDAAKAAGIPIRIGVNGGSLEKRLVVKHGGVTPEALVESALDEVKILEDVDFTDIAISVKHSDPWTMIQTYRLLSERTDYPLHLGVTEAGPMGTGTIKSAVGIGALLSEGIGDTIRVSLSADPVEEVKAGITMLEALHLRERGLDVVSCPSCGRAEVDVYTLAESVQKGLEGIDVPLRVAVMGCVVNGPGEAREADLGVAAGKGKGQILKKGEVLFTVGEDEIVETLVHFANEMAEEIRAERGEGEPAVVS